MDEIGRLLWVNRLKRDPIARLHLQTGKDNFKILRINCFTLVILMHFCTSPRVARRVRQSIAEGACFLY